MGSTEQTERARLDVNELLVWFEQLERLRLIAACLETARAEVKAALDLLEELRS